jgi:hypothetical protein
MEGTFLRDESRAPASISYTILNSHQICTLDLLVFALAFIPVFGLQ